MGRWKDMFELSAAKVPDKSARHLRHRFGPPATATELATLEGLLRGAIPAELRSMFSEFNGIEVEDGYWGEGWCPLYLSTEQIVADVTDYIETSGNPMPPPDELASVAFFAHQNGFAELYAVCIRKFSDFGLGQVLVLDHETGEFELAEESLSAFVSNPEYCVL